MKFGIATFITDEGIRPASLGTAVEERGFNSLIVSEHAHIPVEHQMPAGSKGGLPRDYHRIIDPFVALSSVAAVTRDLVLATGVLLLPLRDVIYTAKEIASLDLISNGRVAMGVGVGWMAEEMRNHGTDPTTRGAKMNEQLAALKQIWTQERAEFHGKFINFDPLFSWPKPVQQPHPPIYIGGESPRALERLRTLGDGWLPQAATPPEQLRRVRQWLTDNGRSDVPFMIWGAERDMSTLASYADVGIDEVTFLLPTRPESETLHDLDELAALADNFS
ncbi:LLM class F420-dependent oxidoreductase [Saccharopolyspora sp. K220]|uniref:LLM class F420-dependent oxidoreductase n=1 Tax=Saccharopolyspora soli TaxID=2926618 RepID=UPI001F583BB4|nr:LLM class F420-dependent oxidoreductase [Saccharopolyspora soli]MCI2420632.1 LLM class F420-dependent oxidoreductase [Saccharopolyspora soli]